MLFNLHNQGSEELRLITGIFPTANDFENIAGEIDAATATVASFVGGKVIEEAEAKYCDSTDEEFVDAVRRPIAILAVATYMAQTLLYHSDTGRKIQVDDNEKIPFQWMVDRDDQAMRDKFYRAMDALFRYLEANNVESWMESDIRRSLAGCIISDKLQLESVFPVDGSWYVYYRLLPLVMEVQSATLVRKVGAELWASLFDEDSLDERLRLLRWHCRRYAVLKAIRIAVSRWSLSVFPLEIARRFAPSYQGNKESREASLHEIDRFTANIDRQLTEVDCAIAEIVSKKNPYSDLAMVPDGNTTDKFFSAQ